MGPWVEMVFHEEMVSEMHGISYASRKVENMWGELRAEAALGGAPRIVARLCPP